MKSYLSFEELLAYQKHAEHVTEPLDQALNKLDVISRAGIGQRLASYRDLLMAEPLSQSDQDLLRRCLDDAGFVSADPNYLTDVIPAIRDAGDTDDPVLLEGETGTGKEVIAECIHKTGLRKRGPLIKVNCGGLPDDLLESELFGHAKGAFSGAHSERKGRFKAADGGIIFLDEIGEMSARAQIKLLRVVDDGKVVPLGKDEGTDVDVKVVCATNKNLSEMGRSGKFREDLYYRLRGIRLTLLPLFLRPGDLVPLLVNLIGDYNDTSKRPIEHVGGWALFELFTYRWPGNVRELKQIVRQTCRICAAGDDNILTHLGRNRELMSAPGLRVSGWIPAINNSMRPNYPLAEVASAVPDFMAEIDKLIPEEDRQYWQLSARLARYAAETAERLQRPSGLLARLGAIGSTDGRGVVPQQQAGPDRLQKLLDIVPHTEALAVFKSEHIKYHLTRHGENKAKTAAAVGVDANTVRNILKKGEEVRITDILKKGSR
jgi:transcriptional regulator with PAS, ATPase and Fis domain